VPSAAVTTFVALQLQGPGQHGLISASSSTTRIFTGEPFLTAGVRKASYALSSGSQADAAAWRSSAAIAREGAHAMEGAYRV
jgi:hypothetical protein